MEINSFMSWIGGKKSSRDIIIPRFPMYYEKYIEVFGGGGWILFGKPPGSDFEVFNDYNSNISNLYTCVRDKSSEAGAEKIIIITVIQKPKKSILLLSLE